jgi:hypothetical protein
MVGMLCWMWMDWCGILRGSGGKASVTELPLERCEALIFSIIAAVGVAIELRLRSRNLGIWSSMSSLFRWYELWILRTTGQIHGL